VAINGAQNMLIAEEAIRFMTELRDQVWFLVYYFSVDALFAFIFPDL
jgi:RecA/RadA recombinase